MAVAFSDPRSRQHASNVAASKHVGLPRPAAKQQVSNKLVSNKPVSSKPGSHALPAAPLTVSAQIDEYSSDPNFMTSLARGLAVIQDLRVRFLPRLKAAAQEICLIVR
jgi:hypothetical protein